jgi:hypothetical protein
MERVFELVSIGNLLIWFLNFLPDVRFASSGLTLVCDGCDGFLRGFSKLFSSVVSYSRMIGSVRPSPAKFPVTRAVRQENRLPMQTSAEKNFRSERKFDRRRFLGGFLDPLDRDEFECNMTLKMG